MNDIKEVLAKTVNFQNDTKQSKKSKTLKVSDAPAVKSKLLTIVSL